MTKEWNIFNDQSNINYDAENKIIGNRKVLIQTLLLQ